jgi:hypothetical protein
LYHNSFSKMPRRSPSSSNDNADDATLHRDQSKGNKAKKRKLDFIEARDGWTKPKRVKNASLVVENDFVSELFDNDAQQYAILCIEQLEDELKCNGYTTGTDVEVVLLFLLPVLDHIRKMTNQAINLHDMGVATLELYELVQFMAVLLLSHFLNFPFHLVIKDMKERNFITPTLERLRWIQLNFKLYSPSQRGDTNGTQNWRSLRDRTKHLDEFESLLFDTIRKCFVHPDHMAITLDDESFGCRAKDNQVKKLNPRKADKEGYACDVIADCYFRMPLGIRFSRRGESQERNVETLVRLSFKTGAASGGTSLLGADRGFARVSLAEFAAPHGLGTVLIFPDHIVNVHPFLSKLSYTKNVTLCCYGDEAETSCFKDFHVDQQL